MKDRGGEVYLPVTPHEILLILRPIMLTIPYTGDLNMSHLLPVLAPATTWS